jgi:hypothetical protein
MKNINEIFSFKRFGLLIKRDVIMKQSFLLIAFAGVLIAITAISILIFGNNRNYRNWDETDQFRLFYILFAILGIIFSSASFPGFRNSKKTMDYLLIPNSMTEKYIYEVFFRIVAYIVLFPVLFWIASNFAGFIFNSLSLNDYDLSYNLWTPFRQIHKEIKFAEGEVALYSLVLLLISVPFTGAAFFSRAPLFKTAIFLALLIGTSIFYGWLLDEIFNFTYTTGFDPDISKETGMKIVTAFLLFSTLVLHASVFFRLKEKEV